MSEIKSWVPSSMEEHLAESMDHRAHVVLGKSSWDRLKEDPNVARALALAHNFYEIVHSKLGPPEITGGTTSSPDDVITLYWEVPNLSKIVGVYVTFKIDGKCSIEWLNGKKSRELTDLTFDDVIKFDVTSKYNSLMKTAPRKLDQYKL